MADRKITDLTALAAGSQATGDLLTIVDVSEAAAADKNKKITVESLFKGIPSSVGVGVASPTFPSGTGIEINDSSTPRLKFSNDTTGTGSTDGSFLYVSGSDFLIENKESANMRFYTSASERLRIDSSGRVLVGTSSAFGGNNEMLQVARSGGGAIALLRNDTSVSSGNELGAISWYGNDSTASTYQECATIRAFADGDHADNDKPTRLAFSTTADGASSPTERMRIDSSGVVTVGTSSTVNPTLRILGSSAHNSFIQFADGDSNNVGQLQYSHSSNALITAVNGTERMRIASNGQLLLNTTSSTYGGTFVTLSSAAGTAAISCINSAGSGTMRQIDFFQGASTGRVGSIESTTTATAYNTSSDYRLKENVTAVTDGITRLQKLKPARFNFIADPDKTVDGFLAHEVQDIVPEAISGEKDAVDDEGNPQYQGIDQSKLVPLLTAALQEAIAEIETLKTKVAALEAG